MKILYFCCGEGLGHATRTISAIRALEKKHEVVCASYGYVKEFIEKSGIEVEHVPTEMHLVGKSGQFDLQKSLVTTLLKSDPSAALKYNKIIKKYSPDLVISDSFFTPALIAKQKKIPVWMVLNQTSVDRFFAEHNKTLLRIMSPVVKQVSYTALEQMDKILIPDFAPPYTICADSIIITPKMYEKTHYIGPLVRKQGHEIKTKPKKKKIFSGIGGFGYRQELLKKIVIAAEQLPKYVFDIVAGPNTKISSKGKNVSTHGSLPDPLPLMNESSIIICGGGHSTIMEAICLGKPVLCAPDEYHFEQEGNAKGVEKVGVGHRIDYKTPPAIIKTLIEELEESESHRKKVKVLQQIAKELDGRKEIAKLADEFSNSKSTK